MTLEDFFTLSEIKDGLTAIPRVEELVSVMQNNKDSVLKNNGDTCRQWTAVASTIAATKNRECLDVFVNLDGQRYLSTWLAEAQMLAKDSMDISLEEAILALLEALGNLGVDNSRLVSSGVWDAVKKLIDHGSSRVQDQAKKLVDSWNDIEDCERSEHDNESCSKTHEDEMRVIAASGESCGQKFAVTVCSTQSNNEKDCLEKSDEALLSRSSEENNPDQDKSFELQDNKVGVVSNVNSHCSDTMTENLTASSTDNIVKEVEENLSLEDKSSVREVSGPTNVGTISIASSSNLNSERDSVEDPSNASLGDELSKEQQMGNNVNILKTLDGPVAVTSSLAGHAGVSSDSIVASMEVENNSLDSNEASKNASETIGGSNDMCVPHDSKQVHSFTPTMDNQISDNSSGLLGDNGRNKKVESDYITSHAVSEGEKDGHSDRKKRVKRRKKRRSSRSLTISQCLGAMDKTSADIDLGILDALEVATKVAQEVAREVESGEEPSHSSSEELSNESEQSGSEDSHTGSPSKGLPVGEENHSPEEPRVGDDDIMDEKNNKSENGIMSGDDDESHLAAAAESEVGREKNPCGFDLNQDIYPDETDVIMSSITSNAAPVMSVSTSGMPAAATLQLEESSSRKGSAATSLFDLNVAEEGDDQVEDVTPPKQLPFSCGESSHEASLRGSSRFNLDLNCINEDDDMPPPPSELKTETRLFLSHNGQQSASPVSSLSVAQPSGKEINFDLNDRPQFPIDSRDHGGPYPWSTPPYRPGISILGTKVDVERRDTVSQMASFLSNGKSVEPGLHIGRMGLAPGVSFSPAPMYGYNGFTGPPPGLSMSSSSPMYAPGTGIPYMVDSRGTPVMMPQIIGSTPYAPQQPPFPQQHLFMSLSSGSPSLNGAARPHVIQSSGFGVEREPLCLRQFLSPELSMGEHSGANAEPSSSSSVSIGGKRKEPETRWEYPPPWR